MKACDEERGPFFVLNTKATWDKGLAIGVTVTDEGIRLQEGKQYSVASTILSPLLLTQLTETGLTTIDFAVGDCDLLYMLVSRQGNKISNVFAYDPHQKLLDPITALTPWLVDPTCMAFVDGKLYVAGTLHEPGHSKGLLVITYEPRTGRVTPIVQQDDLSINLGALGLSSEVNVLDLAIDTRQNHLLLFDMTNHAILRFAGTGQWKVLLQEQLAGAAAVTIAASSGRSPQEEPTLYVLLSHSDRNMERVLKYPLEQQRVETDDLIDFQELRNAHQLPPKFEPAGLAVDREGNIFIGDHGESSRNSEDAPSLHKFTSSGHYLTTFSTFRGITRQLIVDESDRVYVVTEQLSFAMSQMTIVVLDPHITFLRLNGSPLEGFYFSKAFDSTLPRTRWHKLVLDVAGWGTEDRAFETLPDNTVVQAAYLTSDSPTFQIDGEAHDLDTYLEETKRQTNLQQSRLTKLNQLPWRTLHVNPMDALLMAPNVTAAGSHPNQIGSQAPQGQYLWLRFTLTGREDASPVVKSVHVHGPRLSFLRYLPAAFQQDGRSRDFLERFLSLFETFLSGTEQEIAHLVSLFDVDATDGSFLRWLASWLGIAAEGSWSDEELRAFMNRAMELYRARGTRKGLEEIIEIFTSHKPFLLEYFQLLYPHTDDLKRIRANLYDEDPYSFYLFLTAFRLGDKDRMAVRRIVNGGCPAHAFARIYNLQPQVYLGGHTYLGVNTILSIPALRLDPGFRLNDNTVLTKSDSEEYY